MAQILIPVILSGGSGTRLWPLSRPQAPKQLLPLVSKRTMLQDTVLRTRSLGAKVGAPIVICSAAHREQVGQQLAEIDVAASAIVLEPAGRNTAPAIAVAALLASSGAVSDDDPILLVLPADHVIEEEGLFTGAVKLASSAAAAGKLVTFGILPNRPETGYGYIRAGRDRGGWREVLEFVEKPDLATAQGYLSSGEYFWNSGMFIFGARAYLDALAAHTPAMVEPCRAALDGAERDGNVVRLSEAFLESPSDSIDYAVMEKTKDAAVVPMDAGWSDVGSWAALHEVLDKDALGNVFRGAVVAEDCRNCYVLSSGRQVAVIGLEHCVVVETEDAVLVMARDRAQDVKQIAERVAKEKK